MALPSNADAANPITRAKLQKKFLRRCQKDCFEFETPETLLRLFLILYGPLSETLWGFRARSAGAAAQETPVRGGRDPNCREAL